VEVVENFLVVRKVFKLDIEQCSDYVERNIRLKIQICVSEEDRQEDQTEFPKVDDDLPVEERIRGVLLAWLNLWLGVDSLPCKNRLEYSKSLWDFR
jgi:hypothetical protein